MATSASVDSLECAQSLYGRALEVVVPKLRARGDGKRSRGAPTRAALLLPFALLKHNNSYEMDDPLIGFTINFAPAPARDDQEAPRGGLGSQVLPVAELADDYDGSPEDGMEYLFMVRCIEPFSQRCSVGPGADSVHTDAKQRRTPGSTESAIPTRS